MCLSATTLQTRTDIFSWVNNNKKINKTRHYLFQTQVLYFEERLRVYLY